MSRDRITYKINETGYDIMLDGKLWITQYPPYIPYPELTLEECCLKQIDELCSIPDVVEFNEDSVQETPTTIS